ELVYELNQIDKLPLTAEECEYALVTIDTLIHWPDMFPLKTKQAKKRVKALLEIFVRMDLPKECLVRKGE
ncbi:hypothetical protein QOT17_025385, partial [Balamuthia mandrillaris]